jgi:hypothetical protein
MIFVVHACPPVNACLFNCRVWSQVKRSLLHCLWSSPAADAVEQQLSHPSAMTLNDNFKRAQRMQKYAKVVNDQFTQVCRNFWRLRLFEVCIVSQFACVYG